MSVPGPRRGSPTSPVPPRDWEMREAEGGRGRGGVGVPRAPTRPRPLLSLPGDPALLRFEPLPPTPLEPQAASGFGSEKRLQKGRKSRRPGRSGDAHWPRPHPTAPPPAHLFRKKPPGQKRVERRCQGLRVGDPRGCPERGAGGQGSGCGGVWCKGERREAGGGGHGARRVRDLARPGPAAPPARPLRAARRRRGQSLPALPASRRPLRLSHHLYLASPSSVPPSVSRRGRHLSRSLGLSPSGVSVSLIVSAASLSFSDWCPRLAVSPALAPSPELCLGLCPSQSPPIHHQPPPLPAPHLCVSVSPGSCRSPSLSPLLWSSSPSLSASQSPPGFSSSRAERWDSATPSPC